MENGRIVKRSLTRKGKERDRGGVEMEMHITRLVIWTVVSFVYSAHTRNVWNVRYFLKLAR